MTIQLKRNDTKDTISYSMTYADGTPVNLTGATVRFLMGSGKTVITNAEAIIKNATTGEVEYTLKDVDTLVAGSFKAEFEATFDDGKVKTFPTNGYIMVNIQPNIDKDKSVYVEDAIALRVSEIEIFKEEVNEKVTQAVTDASKVTEIQAQVNQLVVEGDSSVEAAQARVKADGTSYTTLRDRLNESDALLAQIAINSSIFNFVGDGISNDAVAFSNMINSNYSTILFPPNGVYKITDTIVNNSGVNKKILFNNSRLIVDFSTTKNFIHFFKNVSLHDVTIDFNNNHCGHGLFYEEGLGKITLRNVTIKNIYDRTLTQTVAVYVKSSGNSLDFDDVTLENLKKYGDGTETTIFEGIYVAPYTTKEVINGGKLSNININEFHRVDVNGTIIKDISNAIYLSGGSALNTECNVLIENLKAYNFGKRLLKAQVSALTVRDVYAESTTDDAMTGLSFQDLDTVRTHNAVTENIVLRGKMRFGVSITTDNTTVDNLDIDIQPATLYSTSSIGLSLGGDDCTIGTGSVKATIPVLGNRVKAIGRGHVKNTKLGKIKLIPQTNSTNASSIIDWTSTNNEPFDGLTLSGTIIERTGNRCGLGLNFGNSTDESYNLILDKVVINDNFDTENTNYGGILQKITGVKYRDVAHNNVGLGSLFRSFNHTNCKNVSIENMDCNAKSQLTANSFTTCTDVIIKGLKGNSHITYLGSFSNTDSLIQSSDMAKMIFNDTFSIQNRKYVRRMTFGTTAQRPAAPYISDEHFDTTLNKNVWCKSISPVEWVDSTGAYV